MNISRKPNGVICIDERPINMYTFSYWLGRYNEQNGTKLIPSKVTDDIIQKYLQEKKND